VLPVDMLYFDNVGDPARADRHPTQRRFPGPQRFLRPAAQNAALVPHSLRWCDDGRAAGFDPPPPFALRRHASGPVEFWMAYAN